MKESFWDRLEQRTRLSGAMASIEEPRTMMRVVTAVYAASVLNALLIAAFFFGFDEPSAGWSVVLLAGSYAGSLLLYVATGSVWGSYVLFALASLANNVYVTIEMGGYANSGAYLMWGIAATAGSTLLARRWETAALGGSYATAAIVFATVDQTLAASRPPPDPALPSILFAYLLVATLVLLVPPIIRFLDRLAGERARSESLLLNVLPDTIARRLKREPGIIADDFSECTVLFADISGFTSHANQVPAKRLVEELNLIFSTFDELAERRGVQKIKTLGDGYMAVAGVPDFRADHLDAACGLALDMQAAMPKVMEGVGAELQLRIGLNTGPAVAGIIGTNRFSYDLWGDTVNVASRMESHGEPGRIQVTEAVFRSASDTYAFDPVGLIAVKDKGLMSTFNLVGRRADP